MKRKKGKLARKKEGDAEVINSIGIWRMVTVDRMRKGKLK